MNLRKVALRGHLNTDAQARDRTRNFLLTRTTPYPLQQIPLITFLFPQFVFVTGLQATC